MNRNAWVLALALAAAVCPAAWASGGEGGGGEKASAVGRLSKAARALAAELHALDERIEQAEESARPALLPEAVAAIQVLLERRAYYAAAWAALMEPVAAAADDDPRVGAAIGEVGLYLVPYRGRMARLTARREASSAALAAARDAFVDSAARLEEGDAAVIEEYVLTQGTAVPEGAIAGVRRGSARYVRWVKEAVGCAEVWRRAMLVSDSVEAEFERAAADQARYADLHRKLVAKRLAVPKPGLSDRGEEWLGGVVGRF